jgi:hypothetical protein
MYLKYHELNFYPQTFKPLSLIIMLSFILKNPYLKYFTELNHSPIQLH